MKLFAVWLLTISGAAFAAGGEGGFPLEHMEPDLDDKASLQRGAAAYMNYCLGCHSLKYQRYERMAKTIGLSGEDLCQQFISETKKLLVL